jgi:hypothetical protein
MDEQKPPSAERQARQHLFLVSSNGWEYTTKVVITARDVHVGWSSKEEEEHSKKWSANDCEDGDVIVADGVTIRFDQGLTYEGMKD